MSKKKKSYMDIGHVGTEGIWIWLYSPHILTAVPASAGTHESIWGPEAMNYWRGRYDEKTGELSAIAPIQWKQHYGVPQWVRQALEERFGADFSMLTFNPQGKA